MAIHAGPGGKRLFPPPTGASGVLIAKRGDTGFLIGSDRVVRRGKGGGRDSGPRPVSVSRPEGGRGGSAVVLAAVDIECGAGNEAVELPRQIDNATRDVVGCTGAPKRETRNRLAGRLRRGVRRVKTRA